MTKTRQNPSTGSPVKKAKTDGTAAQALADASGGSIGQIRDILFGNQMREYEKKFSRMEERILKESAELRSDFSKRFEALDNYVRQEIADLAERLKGEQEKRADTIQKLARDLAAAAAALERRAEEMEKQLEKSNTEWRRQLMEQSHALSEDMDRKYEQTAADLVQTARELRENKIDRGMLADLFIEVAMNLNSDLAPQSQPDTSTAQDG